MEQQVGSAQGAPLDFVDAQLAVTELTAEEIQLVEVHRIHIETRRQNAVAQLGERPEDEESAQAWDANANTADAQAEHDASAEYGSEAMGAAWARYVHREHLLALRSQLAAGELVGQYAGDLSLPQQAQLDEQAAAQVAQQQQAQYSAEQQSAAFQNYQEQMQQYAEAQQAAGQQMAATWEAAAAAGWDPAAASGAAVVDVVGGHVGHLLEPQHAEQQLDMNALGTYEGGYALHQQQLQQQEQQAQQAYEAAGPEAQAQQAQHEFEQMQNPAQPMKTCRRCNSRKAVSDFYRSKANADGYDGRCKACDAIQCSDRRKKKPRIENPTVSSKACHKCNQMKQASEFYRNRTNPDGLYNNCKECFASNSKRRQEALPPIEERMAVSKICRRCNAEKPASEFYKNRLMLDGLYSHCKTCYQAAASERVAVRTMVDSKACRRCQVEKLADEFYKSKMTQDGLQSYCKICYAQTSQNRRIKEPKENRDKPLTSPELEQSLLQERMMADLNGEGALVAGEGGEGPEGQPSEEELELQEAANQEALREQEAHMAQVQMANAGHGHLDEHAHMQMEQRAQMEQHAQLELHEHHLKEHARMQMEQQVQMQQQAQMEQQVQHLDEHAHMQMEQQMQMQQQAQMEQQVQLEQQPAHDFAGNVQVEPNPLEDSQPAGLQQLLTEAALDIGH